MFVKTDRYMHQFVIKPHRIAGCDMKLYAMVFFALIIGASFQSMLSFLFHTWHPSKMLPYFLGIMAAYPILFFLSKKDPDIGSLVEARVFKIKNIRDLFQKGVFKYVPY